MEQPPDHFALEWLDEHGDLLYAYALARVGGDTAVAEDLVQETLLAALKANDRFAGQSSRGTWLVGILRNKLCDHYRRQSRSRERPASQAEDGPSLEDLLADAPAGWGGRPNPADSREFAEVFDKCLENINPLLAQAFILVVMDGLSSQEACSVLEITPTNLSARLCRARLELRRELNARWFNE